MTCDGSWSFLCAAQIPFDTAKHSFKVTFKKGWLSGQVWYNSSSLYPLDYPHTISTGTSTATISTDEVSYKAEFHLGVARTFRRLAPISARYSIDLPPRGRCAYFLYTPTLPSRPEYIPNGPNQGVFISVAQNVDRRPTVNCQLHSTSTLLPSGPHMTEMNFTQETLCAVCSGVNETSSRARYIFGFSERIPLPLGTDVARTPFNLHAKTSYIFFYGEISDTRYTSQATSVAFGILASDVTPECQVYLQNDQGFPGQHSRHSTLKYERLAFPENGVEDGSLLSSTLIGSEGSSLNRYMEIKMDSGLVRNIPHPTVDLIGPDYYYLATQCFGAAADFVPYAVFYHNGVFGKEYQTGSGDASYFKFSVGAQDDPRTIASYHTVLSMGGPESLLQHWSNAYTIDVANLDEESTKFSGLETTKLDIIKSDDQSPFDTLFTPDQLLAQNQSSWMFKINSTAEYSLSVTLRRILGAQYRSERYIRLGQQQEFMIVNEEWIKADILHVSCFIMYQTLVTPAINAQVTCTSKHPQTAALCKRGVPFPLFTADSSMNTSITISDLANAWRIPLSSFRIARRVELLVTVQSTADAKMDIPIQIAFTARAVKLISSLPVYMGNLNLHLSSGIFWEMAPGFTTPYMVRAISHRLDNRGSLDISIGHPENPFPTASSEAPLFTAGLVGLTETLAWDDPETGRTGAVMFQPADGYDSTTDTGPSYVSLSLTFKAHTVTVINVMYDQSDLSADQIQTAGLNITVKFAATSWDFWNLTAIVLDNSTAAEFLSSFNASDSSSPETTGWNDLVIPFLTSGASLDYLDFDHISGAITVTIPPIPGYSISAPETISFVPQSKFLVSGTENIETSQDLVIPLKKISSRCLQDRNSVKLAK